MEVEASLYACVTVHGASMSLQIQALVNKLHAAMYGPQQKAQAEAERMDEVRPCCVLQPFIVRRGVIWLRLGSLSC